MWNVKNISIMIKKYLIFLFAGFIIAQAVNAQVDTSDYVVVKNGHLYLKGERVRYWGAIGTSPGKSYKENINMVKRLKALGFNSVRSFNSPADHWDNPDGMDLLDHFFSVLKNEGMKVWFAGMDRKISIKPEDAGVINDNATEQQWKEAISALKQHKPLCHVWDPRMRAVYLREKLRVLDHYNPHTGYRYADDPVFYAWELTNEDWWFHRMKRGQFLNLPEFFLNELYSQWNDFLLEKYGSHENLQKAWIGNVLQEESLSEKSVMLLPLLNNISDEQAASLGVKTEAGSVSTGYPRDYFNGEREADVIEFLLKIWIEYKESEEKAVKAAGLSTKYSPLVWENGIGWDMQTQYMQQHADAISHDSYFNGTFSTDPHHKRFPWMSQLEELPKVGWDDPWLEHNKMEGKPFFVYETQVMQPAKYRAEYPMTIVKLASIQDWDVINWHYWGHARPADDEHPYDHALDYVTKTHYPQGYHYQYDEVQQSAMTLAGTIFTNFLLEPAPHPTTFVFGRESLYSWDMNDYGDAGEMFVPTVYRYGMRLLIDPSREDDEIVGPRIKGRGVYESCPIVPTEQISHDWQKGHLIFDGPGVVSYTGFYTQYGGPVTFKNGLVLDNVSVDNPDKMPYPVSEDEKYIEFTFASTDGKSLDKTEEAYISLVSTSFNTGFTIQEELHANRPWSVQKEWTWDLKTLNLGSEPVLVARVNASVSAPFLKGMKYELLDWHFNVLERGKIKNEMFEIPSGKPVFLIKLYR